MTYLFIYCIFILLFLILLLILFLKKGDGTIPTSLGAHGRETSDVADRERANVARHALTEQDYSLFLAHFSMVIIIILSDKKENERMEKKEKD